MKCGECFYFERKERKSVEGYCRRYPPKRMPVNKHGLNSSKSPEVKDFNWCGEFKKKGGRE